MSYISLLDEYTKKGYIFEPLKDFVKDKSENLFRRICSQTSGSYSSIKGFNIWVDEILPQNIKEMSFISKDGYKIDFDQVELLKPTRIDNGKKVPLYPQYCRVRRFPYTGELFIRVTVTPPSIFGPDNSNSNGGRREINQKKIKIAEIPIMLMSNRCNLEGKSKEELVSLGECISDPFGYFIIYAEKVVISQDKIRKNIPIVISDSRSLKPFITETYATSRMHIIFMGKKWNSLKLQDPSPPIGEKKVKNFPIFIVFKLLGDIEPEKAIEKYILPLVQKENRRKIKNALDESVIKAKGEDPINYLYVKRNKYPYIQKKNNPNFEQDLRDAFEADIYRHIKLKNKKKRIESKLTLLGQLVAKLALFMIGEIDMDNRDSWSIKRFETPPALMQTLFNSIFNHALNECKKTKGNNKVDYNYFSDALRQKCPNIMKTNFVSSFNTDTWGVKKAGFARTNHSEQYRRETPLVSWSVVTKCVSKSAGIKQSSAMKLQPSQYNRHCVIETPEGQEVGLVKYSTLTSYFSAQKDETSIIDYLRDMVDKRSEKNPYLILINGKPFFIGENIAHGNSDILIYLRDLKRKTQIPFDTEITLEYKLNIISIFTDASRALSPYLIINQETRNLRIEEDDKWDENYDYLLSNGYIELLSSREEEKEEIIISQSIKHLNKINEILKEMIQDGVDEEIIENFKNLHKYSHCVIDPNQMFSVSASTCPMVNRQSSPRGTYQSSMGKQSLGFYNINYHLRFDTMFKQLYRAGRSITETNSYFIPRMDIMPAGQHANVAFYADADNQEDSVVVCEDYLNSKNMTYIKYKTIEHIQNTQIAGAIEKFKIPPLKPDEDPRIYRHLEENGLPKLDSYIQKGDCVIGRVLVTPNGEKNNSIIATVEQEGYVDRILITNDKTSQKPIIKIKLKIFRKYIPGDKMALRYAQKGTVARVASRDQMIRVSSGINKGITPDILFNQHGFPTRMTAGLLIEGLVTKASLYSGERVNVSSYKDIDIEKYKDILEENGFDRNGYEEMEDPEGNKLDGRIFFVPLYEQVLRHQVLDKFQTRNSGLRSLFTHQPLGGRTKGRGLRIGEMEKDAIVAHGASAVIKDRLMKSSDEYRMIICPKCGTIVNDKICKICDNKDVGLVIVPFVFKLLIHLLMGAGIDVRVGVGRT